MGRRDPPAGSSETAKASVPGRPSTICCPRPDRWPGCRPRPAVAWRPDRPELKHLVGGGRPARAASSDHPAPWSCGGRHGHLAAADHRGGADHHVRGGQDRLGPRLRPLGDRGHVALSRVPAAPARPRWPHRRPRPGCRPPPRRRCSAASGDTGAGPEGPAGPAPAGGSLPGPADRGQHVGTQPRRRHRPGAVGQPADRLAQLVDLGPAGRAVREVPVERGPLDVVDRVQRVRADQSVDVGGRHAVTSTPRQSRRRIRPSRIRVLTVGSGVSSRSATSR